MKVIGLTGGIGSGKSTVSIYLIENGYHVLDADLIAREIVLPGSDTLIEITKCFGEELLLDDGNLNRKKLGEMIFSDPKKQEILNGIMHDKITEIILERIVQFKEDSAAMNNRKEKDWALKRRILFIDAPLLYEVGLDRSVSEVWVVDAEEEIRINRIMDRDQISKEEIQKRIRSQMDRQEKLDRADHILENSNDKQTLYTQIDQLLQKSITE